MSRSYYQPIIIFISLSLLVACKKWIVVPSPIDQVTTAAVFSSNASAISAMNGIYSEMTNGNLQFANGSMSLYPALTADELLNTTGDPDATPFQQNAISSKSSVVGNYIWRFAYNYIYQANAILVNVAGSNALDSTVKNQLTGEALFVRAFCFFYLTNLMGDVPITLTTDFETNSKVARAPIANVYQQIVADLLSAQALLTQQYPSEGRVRPNLSAVNALLARVYLYTKDYVKSEAAATAVIDESAYSLLTDLDKIFLANSPETIWALYPSSGYFNTAEGFTFIPSNSSTVPAYVLPVPLLNEFEINDQRKSSWISASVIEGNEYSYPYKYKVKYGSDVLEVNIVLRFAEQYLIRAEARASMGNFSGAQQDLNIIRNRAGLGNTAANDMSSLLQAIMHERRCEFFAEWGHRWFDLKRTGQIDSVLTVAKPSWQSSDSLYPIPYEEIRSNAHLTQNPGYEY